MASMSLPESNELIAYNLGPLLLTWINFSPSMHK